MRNFLIAFLILVCSASLALAAPLAPWNNQTVPTTERETVPVFKQMPSHTALELGDLVDFDAALAGGADYLQAMQADVTDDNAGNGVNGVDETPDDPDDGGWDWRLTSPTDPFHHSTANSPVNIYGATAMGLYYAYLETSDAGYFTAMTDAAGVMIANSNIRSGSDLVFLMLYDDFPAVSGTTYQAAAKAKYDARIATYGTAADFAEYIRDVRAGQGYEDGIIGWDIGVWVRIAVMLNDRYPGNGYDTDADAMAEVLWQDSFNDTPGYFDVVDDAGYDSEGNTADYWWYNLGLTGLIDAFDAAQVHTSDITWLVNQLLASQNSQGFISDQYGGNAGDDSWQATAYAMMCLGRLDQATYQDEINGMGYYLAATQDGASGGWVYTSGNHYPEIGGECTAGLYFTTNGVSDVVVDDDFTSQDDVDIYNAAHSTSYVWGYTAFATIGEAMAAVSGTTINVAPGTYYETLNITLDGLSIIGEDRATVIIDPTGLATDNAGIYVDADNVTLQSLTLNSTVASSLPRYGIKVGDVDGCTIEDVTATEVYRSGFDCLGSSNLTLTNIAAIDNGGHGLALTDCNGVAVTDFTASGNGWQNVSVVTWGRYTPLGCSDIVFSGANSFGDLFQLEMGDYNNSGVPPAGDAVITYSTNIADGADVTVQASDFGFALHGEQDDSPDIARLWFFSTLANAAVLPGMGGGGHWTGNDMYIESLTDDTQLYVAPGCSFAAAIAAADPGDTINVSAGTYTETIAIDKTLSVVGADGKSLTNVTGGVTLTNGVSGVTLQYLNISGVGASSSVIRALGANTDFTIDNCVVDCEGVAGRFGYTGGSLLGDVTITYCEFKNCAAWALFDSRSGSGGDGSAMGTITFAHNYIHESDGSIVFRGLSTDRTDVADVYGNTWENIGDNYASPSQHWAAFEMNRTVAFNFYDNTITNVALGEWGEGQGLQMWDIDNLDLHDNVFTNCYQGVWVYSGGEFPAPGGAMYHNSIVGSTDYACAVDATITGGILNAEQNYWGAVAYGDIAPLIQGAVDFDPWCVDAAYTNCTLTYPVTEVWVDAAWAGSLPGDVVDSHVFGYNAFATIQDGVDAVSGSTVHVAAGTYVEQVHITLDDLVLEGSGVDVTIIQSPASLADYFNTGSHDTYPVVFVDGATNVTITDLTVDGNGQGNANSHFVGVGFWNAGGTIDGAKVIGVRDTPFSGAQHGVAVYSYNNTGGPYTIAMQDVEIYDFQKNAVGLLGSGLTVDLNNVTTTGAGATSVTAQNGIQIGAGVTGTLDNCDIADVAYTGADWTATGFLNQGDVTATGLNISGCQTSVYWIDGSGSFDGGTISGPLGDGFYAYNSTTAKAAEPKVLPQPIDADLTSSAAKAVMNVSLTNTTITGTGAADSWGAGAFSTSTDPVNMTITGCTIDNFDYGYVAYNYGGPVNSTVNGNAIINCTYGMAASAGLAIQDGTQNWWGTFDAAAVAAQIDGDIAYSPWWGANYVGDPHTSPWSWYGDNTGLIQDAIDLMSAGDLLYLAAGTYAEGPTITVDKDISIIGEAAKSLVTITPTGNTGSSGDARAWILVNAGVTFNLSNVELDGSGYQIYQAIRSYGGGTIDNCEFRNIAYSQYIGVALTYFGMQDVTISNCYFENIQRVGALLYGDGLGDSYFINNTYLGKGDGDWLDYAADISAGAVITAYGNTITNCTGVASSDGSTSAGLLVTTYYAPGTALNAANNAIKYCTAGIAIGYDASDASMVALTGNNRFLGNDYGITTTASSSILLSVWGNIFANTVNAEDNTSGGMWDDGISIGNCWSDFDANSGYPTQYNVAGSAGAIDHYPNTDCGIVFGPPEDILYHCDGDLDLDVSIGNGVEALEGAEMTIEYPAEMTLVGVTSASSNYFLAYSLTDNTVGNDVLLVNLGVQVGWQDGPADLFTVTLNGNTSYCAGTTISMTAAELRDTANSVITMPLPGDITMVADCNDPVLTVNTTSGECWNVPPVVNLEASDDCDLDEVFYQIDGCSAGGWVHLAGPLSGTTWGPSNYTMSAADFLSLSEGAHCVYFKVTDDNERENANSCDCWAFTKDTAPPAAPTDLVASPGHNKITLSWTNPTSDFDHVVVMRSDWNGSGHGYPEYGSPDNGTAEGPYPSDTSTFDLVYSGTDATFEDTDDLSNTTRDVYHYTVFTVDCGGNVSTPVASSQTRATSYWLGDVAGTGGPGDYDGFVYSQDLSVFSFAYWTGPMATAWNAECDFAPTETAKAGPKDIPIPDDSVDFEDLIIFAINYDDVAPTYVKDRPILAGTPYSSATCLRLKGRVEGDYYLVDVLLDNGRDLAKAVDAQLRFDESSLHYISTERSVDMANAGSSIFFMANSAADRVNLSAAVLGAEATFSGSGKLATVKFQLGQSGNTSVEILRSMIRGVDNQNVNTGTSVADASAEVEIPVRFTVAQNRPNPFNPLTEIAYGLPTGTNVSIKVYNITGQVVKTLVDSYQPAGMHSVVWDATNENGVRVASGIYFYRFETAEFQKTVKMTLLK